MPQTTAQPGTILEASRKGNYLLVAAGDQTLKIVELQPEGKAVMPVSAYLNGAKIEAGMRFE